jgi:hypothetical protein
MADEKPKEALAKKPADEAPKKAEPEIPTDLPIDPEVLEKLEPEPANALSNQCP